MEAVTIGEDEDFKLAVVQTLRERLEKAEQDNAQLRNEINALAEQKATTQKQLEFYQKALFNLRTFFERMIVEDTCKAHPEKSVQHREVFAEGARLVTSKFLRSIESGVVKG